jgi:hypothetical protein
VPVDDQNTLAKQKANMPSYRPMLKGLLLASVIAVHLTASAASSITITITRQHADKSCTSGQLALNGEVMGYTLERPVEGNIPLISAVPAGTYRAFVRTESKDRWRVELINVPGRGNVQIHVGNTLRDTIGCVLLGVDLGNDMCTVKDSKTAFDKFKLAFAKESGGAPERDVEVMVVIKGIY